MKVGFFSSSTPITNISPTRFQRAERFMESKGITLVAGNLTGQQDFYRSGSIKRRAEEINQLIHDDSINILMATIGGLNTNAILVDLIPTLFYLKLISIIYRLILKQLLAIRMQPPCC
ncbi:LD-carboxypeptidase [Companilactobacillus crustorum]|uniref:LD-carboxypeptidase n=1 Tax=Companilactobacillus crustorum TaxID=392416 RepID=UPI0026A45A8D